MPAPTALKGLDQTTTAGVPVTQAAIGMFYLLGLVGLHQLFN